MVKYFLDVRLEQVHRHLVLHQILLDVRDRLLGIFLRGKMITICAAWSDGIAMAHDQCAGGRD